MLLLFASVDKTVTTVVSDSFCEHIFFCVLVRVVDNVLADGNDRVV